MSNTEGKLKVDVFFAIMAMLLMVSSICMIVASIWMDWRWLPTAIIAFLLGLLCAAISEEIDERHRKAAKADNKL